MSNNFRSSPRQPTSLHILQETKLSPTEVALLIENAVARVRSVTDLTFDEDVEHSRNLSEIIIQAIAQNKKLILTYNEWDKNERKMPRQVIPLALYYVKRIPGEPILSKWKHGTPYGDPTYIKHCHLKVSVFQTDGHTQVMKRGFKELNLSDITNLWTSRVDPDEDDIQEIKEGFVLDNMNAEYILQFNQTSLQKYREQLLALLPQK